LASQSQAKFFCQQNSPEIDQMQRHTTEHQLPQEVAPPELSFEHQWYLYKSLHMTWYSTAHEQRRVWSRVGCETRTCVMRAKRVQLPHSFASIAVHMCYTRTFVRGEDSGIQNTRQPCLYLQLQLRLKEA